MEVVAWIGFSQALFSGILTLSKNEKSISDRLLTAWLFMLALEFLTFGLESKIFPNFLLLTNSFLLFNPALYLYTRSLTDPAFRLKWSQLLHLTPYFFFKILAWIIEEPQTFETFFLPNSTLWFRIIFTILGIVSWAVYLTLSGNMVREHRKKIMNEFSTIDTYKKIGWILFIIVFFILYCFTVFVWGVFNLFYFDSLSLSIFNYSVLLIFIYVLGFYGLQQKQLYKRESIDENSIKLQTSFLSDMIKDRIRKKVIQYFEKEQPYINPELNMTLLSENLKIPKHHLTEVLNGTIGKNFFQFVNEYRIEAVKQKLSNPKNLYSIEAIGYECGFNSKSTFFSVFKNITGMTPAAYKKTLNL